MSVMIQTIKNTIVSVNLFWEIFMEDYIDILLEYISQERLSTMSRKHIAYLAQE